MLLFYWDTKFFPLQTYLERVCLFIPASVQSQDTVVHETAEAVDESAEAEGDAASETAVRFVIIEI